MNNGKYQTDQYKKKQSEKVDRLFGKIEDHVKTCECCASNFIFTGRIKTKEYERSKYCSRSCANSIGGKAKSQKYHNDDVAQYTTVAWRHHKKECIVCGENIIVAVHHVNENHMDNRPENLVPLCPTHHQYMNSKHKILIESVVEEYIKSKWAVSVVGGTRALQA